MSVVAVNCLPGQIVIACDEQVNNGGHKYLIGTNKEMFSDSSKMFQENGMTIGCVGTAYEASMMKIFSKTHKPKDATVDSILDFLTEFDNFLKSRESGHKLYNDHLIIYEGKAFVCYELQVELVGKYNAIGSGSFLALGAFSMGATAEQAVEVAIKHDLHCGGNVNEFVITINDTESE